MWVEIIRMVLIGRKQATARPFGLVIRLFFGLQPSIDGMESS